MCKTLIYNSFSDLTLNKMHIRNPLRDVEILSNVDWRFLIMKIDIFSSNRQSTFRGNYNLY